jgi:hypothetical protein
MALNAWLGNASTGDRRHTGGARILLGMSKRTIVAGAVWIALSVLAFLVDPILGACVLIFGAIGVVVVQLASNWDDHPDYEARELVRARRRKVKWEKSAGKREKDAARYAAHQARQAEKSRRTQEQGAEKPAS